MKNFKLIFSMLFLVLSLAGKSQWPESKEPKSLISIVPQYIVVNGLRIDFDKQLSGSKWLSISPYYYSDISSLDLFNLGGSDSQFDGYSYESMWGAGIGIAQRNYLSKQSDSEGIYVSYGAEYKYFQINGNNYTWIEFTGDDGLSYQELADLEYRLKINSLAAKTIIGYQWQYFPSLFLDFYIGFGIKYGIHTSPQKVTIKYNRGTHDYGYTGTHLIGGFRIGVAFE